MMENPRTYNIYFTFIVGCSFGFEFFTDDEGDSAQALSLGIIRVIRTKDILHGN